MWKKTVISLCLLTLFGWGLYTSKTLIIPPASYVHIINDGAITATSSHILIATEYGDALDHLDQIDGGRDGQLLLLRIANASQQVIVRCRMDGNIAIPTYCYLRSTQQTLLLIYDATQQQWLELSRSSN